MCDLSEAMTTIAQRLKFAREKKGYARAVDAARAHGWVQSTYLGHENGDRVPSRGAMARYATAFGVSIGWLLAGERDGEYLPPATFNAPPEIFGNNDLPVYASAEGGNGSMVVNTTPIDHVPRPWYFKKVKEGYAVLVSGSSMEPVFAAGDMAIVNPRAPLRKGKEIILVSGEERGEFTAIIKRLVDSTPAEWILKQFNPPEGQTAEFRLFRHEWPTALRVVGKYDGD